MRLGLIAAVIALTLDQLSKWAVVEHFFKPQLGLIPLSLPEWYGSQIRIPFAQVEILPFFNFTMMWNEGVGFGMLGVAGPMALIALSLIICAVLVGWMWREKDRYLHVVLGMIVGGALGNVLDRFRYGAVVDFLDVHAFGWHYPTFNIADSCIVVGVALLLLQPVFQGKVRSS